MEKIGVHLSTFSTQRNNEDYKPVNPSFPPSISTSSSLHTIIDSLEKPQLEHPVSSALNLELVGEVSKLSDDSTKNNSYLKEDNSSTSEQNAQTVDSPASMTANVCICV